MNWTILFFSVIIVLGLGVNYFLNPGLEKQEEYWNIKKQIDKADQNKKKALAELHTLRAKEKEKRKKQLTDIIDKIRNKINTISPSLDE